MARAREQLEKGFNTLQTSGMSPHSPASLLKNWVAELDEPVFPSVLYEDAMAHADDIDYLTSLVYDKMPEINRRVLLKLISLCRRTWENEEVTKMGPRNLAVVWSPNVFKAQHTDPEKILRMSKQESVSMCLMIEKLPLERPSEAEES